ncbi:MAG: hypothetical protein B6I35_15815 [Anaerolineaceae bacterium 4572_32.2]|nr:MAG: hypothetical protein B6I35_15815 [Anaerolineaceae bacterium 4572_32.2]
MPTFPFEIQQPFLASWAIDGLRFPSISLWEYNSPSTDHNTYIEVTLTEKSKTRIVVCKKCGIRTGHKW